MIKKKVNLHQQIKSPSRKDNNSRKKHSVDKVAEIAQVYTPELATGKHVDIEYSKICSCPPSHLSCITAKEWIKAQLGVWQFNYEGRDIRDKTVHPATFPISLARKVIALFTHEGELVLDPFVGSGTSLLAAMDLNRNAIGFDLQPSYIDLSKTRLGQKQNSLFPKLTTQLPFCDDAQNINEYLKEETVKLLITSPPYANMLNRQRLNKSRRSDTRKNGQYLKIEQYSQDTRDLGTMDLASYAKEMQQIFAKLLPFLKPGAHCVIDVPDMWWQDERITIHLALITALREVGYELRNTIIWDRTNIVNKIGIFGWPSNYITMGTTFEYLLDFRKRPAGGQK